MTGYIGYFIVAIIVGYFLGCIQTGYFVGRLCGLDIRQYGSGNAGTTNVLRTLGKGRALITFLGDALKGMIPVLIIKFAIGPAVPGLNSELLQLVLEVLDGGDRFGDAFDLNIRLHSRDRSV